MTGFRNKPVQPNLRQLSRHYLALVLDNKSTSRDVYFKKFNLNPFSCIPVWAFWVKIETV